MQKCEKIPYYRLSVLTTGFGREKSKFVSSKNIIQTYYLFVAC